MNLNRALLKKYDVPVPRYTSYPTVPYWTESPSREEWVADLRRHSQTSSVKASLYVHVPFCETLCTFCGCNTVITKSHDREPAYLTSLKAELNLYLQKVPELREVSFNQVHLGGGTPTFLAEDHLRAMVESLLQNLKFTADFEGSIEVDPRRTRLSQLQILFDLGFRRVSMGVQDFNPEVQRLVNRIQPFAVTKQLTEGSRLLGYESVNFDLIYGLPKQTLMTFAETIEKTIELRPDRIALYSFALVPWIKPQQRLFKDEDLPQGAEKRELYEMAYEKLTEAGYHEIGMDHFALDTDSLYKSNLKGELHRNFMGYSERRTDILLGLGVSSISETPTCFHQNEKVLTVYERLLQESKIPTYRGHRLSVEDQLQREQILMFMTTMRVILRDEAQENDVREFLGSLIEDGLVTIADRVLTLSPLGKPFLRNACMALDLRLRRHKPASRIFSSAC